MKKNVFVLLNVAVLLALTLTSVAAACPGGDDPTICVNGQWLTIDAASQNGISVRVPADARYGNQQQGGCQAPQPSGIPLLSSKVVKETGGGHQVKVQLDGKLASEPKVTVSYGSVSQTKSNNGKQTLNFNFDLR